MKLSQPRDRLSAQFPGCITTGPRTLFPARPRAVRS